LLTTEVKTKNQELRVSIRGRRVRRGRRATGGENVITLHQRTPGGGDSNYSFKRIRWVTNRGKKEANGGE